MTNKGKCCILFVMIENPVQRVFHIDHECYLIYLGSSHTEYRPFLRIGNSPKLPEEIKKYVSTVLVTDNYTGNPFLEHENVELPLSGETRFVGDPLRIERLKQFLNEKNLPVAEYEYETVESPPQKGKSIVFFFKNGNLHVHHNGDELYNLRQREVEDLHFVYLAERVSSFVKDNPLRYLSRVFQNPGFILVEQNLYLFHEGRLGIVHIPTDFTWALSRAGIDPDLLQWCIEDRFEEGILHKLKRSVAIKRELRVASRRIEQLRSAINLFSGGDTSLFAVEPDVSGCFHLQGFRFCGEELSVEFPSSQGISFPLTSVISEGKSVLQKALEKKGLPAGTRIVGKVPYRFLTTPLPSPGSLLLSYGIDLAKNCAEVGEVQEQDWWRGLVSSLTQIQEQWKKSSPRLSSFDVLEPLFTSELSLGETEKVLPYLIWNLETLCRIIDSGAMGRGSLWDRLRKKARNRTLFHLPEDRQGCIPLVGDCWILPNGGHLFYQVEGRLSPLKLLQASKSIENIEKLRASIEKETYFTQERERLLRFLEQLHQVPPKRIRKPVASPSTAATQSATTETSQPPEPETSTLSSVQAAPDAFSTASSDQPGQGGILPQETPLSASLASSTLATGERKLQNASLSASASESTPFGRAATVKSTGMFHRRWGIYAVGVLVLGGIIVALWQFGRPEPIQKTVQVEKQQELSASREVSKELQDIGEQREKGVSTTQKEGPPQTGHESGGAPSKETPEVREASPVPARQQTSTQAGPAETRPTEALPSTYTADIPPLGAIQITVLDVFYLVNKIAETNGYRRLDSLKDLRPDPNWIFPGNRFKLPDASTYVVKRGDTLWHITTRYIEEEVAKGIGILKSYLGPTLESPVPKDKQYELEETIGRLQKGSHCKAFVEYLEKKKKEVMYR